MGQWQRIRRRLLTPSVTQTRLDVRGFYEKTPEARALLERVGATFLIGFGHGAEARSAGEAEPWLDEVAAPMRGFAYEGAAMSFAIRDALPFSSGRLVADFLAGAGDRHSYMAYVGVGWAMARLPRARWSRLHAPDNLLRWLVLDGYGFHQAYFRTEKYVGQRYQAASFGWPVDGPPGYATRVIDQGIGRAMWFVAGTDVRQLVGLVGWFDEHRRADLFAGAGLAATYAGGADDEELQRLWRAAGEHQPYLAQGAVFGAAARTRAGLVVEHNERATAVLCSMSTAEATDLAEETRPERSTRAGVPAYELWRQRIADRFRGRA